MDVTPHTLLRGFLLIGGLAFVIYGLVDWSLFNLGLGIVAAVLGGFGLWWEFQTAREQAMNR